MITKWINLIKLKKPVILHNNKNILRDFCHVNDAVSSIILSFKYLKKNKQAELFNIAFGKSISLKKLLSNILQYFKKKNKKIKPNIRYEQTPKENIIMSKISITKAKKKLNYLPRTNIKKGLYLSF